MKTTQELQQIAKDYVKPHSLNFNYGEEEGFVNDLVAFAEHLQAISQMQPEWVSVSERLPEIGLGGIQILLEDSHSKERLQMTANYDGEWIFPRDPAERVKVIYWHYLLPQPNKVI